MKLRGCEIQGNDLLPFQVMSQMRWRCVDQSSTTVDAIHAMPLAQSLSEVRCAKEDGVCMHVILARGTGNAWDFCAVTPI